MNWIVRIVLFLIGNRAKLQMVREAKRHGLVAYMRALQGTRHALIGAFAAFFIFQLMLLSLVGALVTGFYLWDADMHLKMQILFGVFATLFALPLIGLCVLFSERLWYKFSGAQKMVDEIQTRKQRDAV